MCSVRVSLCQVRKRLTNVVLFSVFSLLLIAPNFARAEFPERNITMVVCFPPGGSTDVAARLVSAPLGDALGKPVIVENRGGAGGNIATAVVARSAADGYTLLVCSSAYVVNPSLYKHATYNPLKDFVPVMALAASPNVFVVSAQSRYKTLQDVIAAAKSDPGKLNWTSSGVGTTPNLAGELLKQRTGIDIVHIPFAGAGPATVAAISGQVDMFVATLGSVRGLIEGGKLRPIAVASLRRSEDLPDVPTLEELGIENAESNTFNGVFAPAGTPKPVVDRLANELEKILSNPELQRRYLSAGMRVIAEGPEKFRERIAHEVPTYKAIIEKAGLSVD